MISMSLKIILEGELPGGWGALAKGMDGKKGKMYFLVKLLLTDKWIILYTFEAIFGYFIFSNGQIFIVDETHGGNFNKIRRFNPESGKFDEVVCEMPCVLNKISSAEFKNECFYVSGIDQSGSQVNLRSDGFEWV